MSARGGMAVGGAALVFVRLLACGNGYSLDSDAGASPSGEAGSDTNTGPPDADSDAGQPCTVTCDSHHCDDDGGCHPLVFVTSLKVDGSFQDAGGLQAADTLCTSEATAASLQGKYLAWLSTSTVDAITRVTASAGANRPVWERSGDRVATSYSAMILNTLDAGISSTANGATVPTTDFAWTGTNANGAASPAGTCHDWTSGVNADNASAGELGVTSAAWTTAVFEACNNANHLYCFEVVP